MKEYVSPSVHVIEFVGPLGSEEIAALTDAELEDYLKNHGFAEHSRLYAANGDYSVSRINGRPMLVLSGKETDDAGIMLSEICVFLWGAMKQPKTMGDLRFAVKNTYD